MNESKSEIREALSSCRDAFVTVGGFSFFINLLMLVSPLYMMQVYNRVLPSRSDETLLVLTLLAGAMLAVMGILEAVRARVLVRVSGQLDVRLSERVLAAIFASSLKSPRSGGVQGLRDFDNVRQFLAGAGTFAFFDAPWTPIIIAIVFLFHPLLGIVATIGAVLLFGLALTNELATRRPLEEANRHSVGVSGFVESSLRNAEVLEAMGMFGNFRRYWARRRTEMLRLQSAASDRAGAISALTKSLRLLLQIALLGTGAYLANRGEITPGVIIASSILVGRALAPIEVAIGSWKQFVSARTAYARLNALLASQPAPMFRTSLPRPKGDLQLESVTAVPPGGNVPTLRQVSFALPAGQVLGVVGPSGAGKSTLARLIVGAWRPYAGKVRLDGADVHSWNREELGPYVGYLPQDVELFDGTVSENIARIGELDSAKIVTAAKRAGVHEMILRLPSGYDAPIGPGGCVLSGGQRQRIGLARALYGDPALVVLDEPNSNLDEDGENALAEAIMDLKQAGTTVVIVSHRPSVLSTMDQILVLADGMVRAFGARNDVLSRLTRSGPVPAAPRAATGRISAKAS